jgi:hypothetical protein
MKGISIAPGACSVPKILKIPQWTDEDNLTLEQIQAVPCSTAPEPLHSELTDELDRIWESRKSSEK